MWNVSRKTTLENKLITSKEEAKAFLIQVVRERLPMPGYPSVGLETGLAQNCFAFGIIEKLILNRAMNRLEIIFAKSTYISSDELISKILDSNEMEGPARILVVDDDPCITNMIQRALRQFDYEIRTAQSVSEAEKHFESFEPDLITLDVRMPETDGLTFLKQIREREGLSSTQVLMISGGYETHRAKAIYLGAQDFLPKPFDNKVLLEKVQNILTL